MALYENGILISGANTLPQMTLAEYQALPVSERPTYWERTDLNYNNIPASDVTYGSGSVEDALDDLFGIPIKQFTIASNETITLSNVFCVMLRTSGVAGGIHIINMGWGSYSYALGGTSTGCTLSASGYNLTITNTNAYSVACVKIMNAV